MRFCFIVVVFFVFDYFREPAIDILFFVLIFFMTEKSCQKTLQEEVPKSFLFLFSFLKRFQDSLGI